MSSSDDAAPPTVAPTNWHGYLLAAENLPPPHCVIQSGNLARPDCKTGVLASEYVDSAEVLSRKADLLISMFEKSTNALVYAGAGISTSSGIQDYASQAKGSVVMPRRARLTMDFINALRPTPAHRVLTAMEKRGLIWGWLQQNHDGLAQKAGFPTEKVNEIHGSWLDGDKNPIIAMSGSLRGDLFEWCLRMEQQCDFVFALGTSFSGLNADRCADSCAKRHMKKNQGQGIAVLSIQKTTKDDVAALRIFSKIDDFMLIVAQKLNLQLDTKVHTYVAPSLPVGTTKQSVWLAERKAKREAHEDEKRATAIAARAPQTAAAKPSSAVVAPAPPQAVSQVQEPIATPLPVAAPKPAPTIRVGNRHTALNAKLPHKWTMYVESQGHAIESVTYQLHPTFTPSEVTVTKEDSPSFSLCRLGWGTFPVGVVIHFADGRKVETTHELSFTEPDTFEEVRLR